MPGLADLGIELPVAGKEVTTCEIHGHLVHRPLDRPSSSYATVEVPGVRIATPAGPSGQQPDGAAGAAAAATPMDSRQLLSLALSPLDTLQRWLMGHPLLPNTGQPPQLPLPASWHPHKGLLAAVAPGGAATHVFDLSAALPPTAVNGSSGGGRSTGDISAPRATLSLEVAQGGSSVGALAWRPHSAETLALGCRGGVALWDLLGPASDPTPAGPGGAAAAGAAAAAVAGAAATCGSTTWLPLPRGWFMGQPARAQPSSLAWSPDGRLLAAASPSMPGMVVWDVAFRAATPISAGWAALSLLAWSPCGHYLFAAGPGPKFYIWETSRWAWQAWAFPGGGSQRVMCACWSPDSRVLLVAFTGSEHLVALHMVASPPSLKAHMLPVTLPDLRLRAAENGGGLAGGWDAAATPPPATPNNGAGSSARAGAALGGGRVDVDAAAPLPPPPPSCIADMAWDPRGERLVVALQAPHPAAGSLAVYATTFDPVVTARLVGLARPPPAEGENGAGAAAGATAGYSRSLCYYRHFGSKGALLSARLAPGYVYNLPLYYR